MTSSECLGFERDILGFQTPLHFFCYVLPLKILTLLELRRLIFGFNNLETLLLKKIRNFISSISENIHKVKLFFNLFSSFANIRQQQTFGHYLDVSL